MTSWPPVYLHLDLNILDPVLMPAVRDPIPNGLALETLIAAIEVTAASAQVNAMGVTNFFPAMDLDNRGAIISVKAITAAVRILAI